MSSGFVSSGTVDAPIERSDEWLVAQKEIDANRQRKLDEQARQSDGRSLYETLEANKAAKQDAFEETNRLKNQFRALDEDEVDFLDSVLESTRAEEHRVKKETAEGLALFRQQQEEADKKARKGSDGAMVDDGSPAVNEESWIAGGRKRKRIKEKEVLKGVKIRRASAASQNAAAAIPTEPSPEAPKASIPLPAPKTTTKLDSSAVMSTTQARPKGGQGLVAYGSDSEDD